MNELTIYRLHLTTISRTGRETHTYLLAYHKPADGTYPVHTDIDTTFFDYAEVLTDPPACPVCGSRMRQIRRGATLARRGPAYICPVSEAEVERDANGHLYIRDDAQHDGRLVWHLDELTRWERCASCGRPQNINPLYRGRFVCNDCYNDALDGETW